MPIIARYILAQTLKPLLLAVAVALLLLLIERMLRLLDLVLNSQGSIDVLLQLLAFLVPHYMGLALPAAFFIGLVLTFSRLQADNEIDALGSAGLGLQQLILPTLWMAIILTAITAFVFSHLQPYTRYTYRALVHELQNGPLNNYLSDGVFITAKGTTYMAETIDTENQVFIKVFAFQEESNGDRTIVTATRGRLVTPSVEEDSLLLLREGRQITITDPGEATERSNTVDFQDIQVPVELERAAPFRPRGIDEREMTLPELWRWKSSNHPSIPTAVIEADFHDRLVRIFAVMLLPFLAIPLSASGGRRRQSQGIVLGLILLVVFNKLVSIGENLAVTTSLPASLSLWTPFGILALFSALLFWRSAFRAGGLQEGILTIDLGQLFSRIRQRPLAGSGESGA